MTVTVSVSVLRSKWSMHVCMQVWNFFFFFLPTFPTAASPKRTNLTLLLGFGVFVDSDIVARWNSRRYRDQDRWVGLTCSLRERRDLDNNDNIKKECWVLCWKMKRTFKKTAVCRYDTLGISPCFQIPVCIELGLKRWAGIADKSW